MNLENSPWPRVETLPGSCCSCSFEKRMLLGAKKRLGALNVGRYGSNENKDLRDFMVKFFPWDERESIGAYPLCIPWLSQMFSPRPDKFLLRSACSVIHSCLVHLMLNPALLDVFLPGEVPGVSEEAEARAAGS